MTEKINIAELLKDCPSGMELDCTIWDNVVLAHVDVNSKYPIWIKKMGGEIEFLTENGCFNFDCSAKCIIFPKGKTTWEGFHKPFEDGDILFVDCSDDVMIQQYIFILNNPEFYGKWYSYCHLNIGGDFYFKKAWLADDINDVSEIRLATEEEKARLFQAIKDNGYKWNADTKTLEILIKPEFKIGNKVRHKTNHNVVFTIDGIEEDFYTCAGKMALCFSEQDSYELVPNKFDINTLKPFDKVLMRSSNAREWVATFYSHYSDNKFYGCGMCCDQCIPYEGNEHLLGTADDCNEYFKTW